MLEVKSLQYTFADFNHKHNCVVLQKHEKGVIKVLDWNTSTDGIFGLSFQKLNVLIDKSDEKMKCISLLLTKGEFDPTIIENLPYLGMYHGYAIWMHSISEV